MTFDPSHLNRTLHAVALRTAGNQPVAARELIEQALCSVEAWLLQATDPATADVIIAATATARLLTETARARQFLDDDDKPEPPPLPPHGGGSPFPVLFDWEAM